MKRQGDVEKILDFLFALLVLAYLLAFCLTQVSQ
jgi:hypothetical protein